MQYEQKILNELLDRYERSILSRGENTVAVHIAFAVTKKTLPVYFDENSLAYEEIHAVVNHLEELGYIQPVWKNGRKNHILQKVVLCDDCVEEIYQFLGRVPEREQEQRQLQILKQLKKDCTTFVAGNFTDWIIKRLEEGKSVKEYIKLDDLQETRRLIQAVEAIEKNQQEIYIREFSVRCFGDSKEMEKREGVLGKIFRRFSDDFTDMDNDAIFAEYDIYHTPNYVYIKGCGSLYMGKKQTCKVELGSLQQGIGLAGEDIETIQWCLDIPVKKVVTIENLTTFFRWEEPESILIYLGGYHNTVRRKLLRNIYTAFPCAEYLHFGDIDVGGFEIYQNLRQRTGIPFQTYYMGCKELLRYKKYSRELTVNDRKRLGILLENEEYRDVWPVLKYMKECGRKLERESIRQELSDK